MEQAGNTSPETGPGGIQKISRTSDHQHFAVFVSVRAVECANLILLFVKLLGFYTVYTRRKLLVLD